MSSLDEVAPFGEIPMKVEVELDRRTLTVRDLLSLKEGSVIKMTRSAGENIDILIAGRLVGFGEIVVIENTTGVRITDLITDECN